MQIIELQAGDIIVIKSHEILSENVKSRSILAIKKILKGVEILYLDGNKQLDVLRKEE